MSPDSNTWFYLYIARVFVCFYTFSAFQRPGYCTRPFHAVTHLGTDKVCHGLGRSRIRSRDYCIEIRCATIEPRLLLIQYCFSCWMAGFNSLTIGPTYSPGTAVHLKTFYETTFYFWFYKLLSCFAKRSSSHNSKHCKDKKQWSIEVFIHANTMYALNYTHSTRFTYNLLIHTLPNTWCVLYLLWNY